MDTKEQPSPVDDTGILYEPPLVERGRVTMLARQAQLPELEWDY